MWKVQATITTEKPHRCTPSISLDALTVITPTRVRESVKKVTRMYIKALSTLTTVFYFTSCELKSIADLLFLMTLCYSQIMNRIIPLSPTIAPEPVHREFAHPLHDTRVIRVPQHHITLTDRSRSGFTGVNDRTSDVFSLGRRTNFPVVFDGLSSRGVCWCACGCWCWLGAIALGGGVVVCVVRRLSGAELEGGGRWGAGWWC